MPRYPAAASRGRRRPLADPRPILYPSRRRRVAEDPWNPAGVPDLAARECGAPNQENSWMNSSDPPGAPAGVRCAWPSDRTAACPDLTVKPDYYYGHHTPRGRVQVEVGDGVRGRDDTGIRVLTVIITICTVDIDCHGGTDGTTPRQSRGGTRNDCQKG